MVASAALVEEVQVAVELAVAGRLFFLWEVYILGITAVTISTKSCCPFPFFAFNFLCVIFKIFIFNYFSTPLCVNESIRLGIFF